MIPFFPTSQKTLPEEPETIKAYRRQLVHTILTMVRTSSLSQPLL
jgi:hypothetical protein